jgi:proteasome lid subunit RPN8/RPN11
MTSWQTPLCPFAIGFTADKLDEIRIAVVEGFYTVPRGGIEIGGVLYGKRLEGLLLITDYRKIETEYLTGPSFSLSENDEEGLKKLLMEAKFDDPQIAPVGWFHSHTRSGIHLSEKDLKLFHEFFPEPWQVALVLKPDSLGPVRGGYFFRDREGAVKADASALEFTVAPYFGEKRPVEERPVDSVPVEIPVEPVPAAEPVVQEPAAALASTRTVAPPRFQTLGHGTSIEKRTLWALLAAALAVSAVAGYWVAIR